MRGEEKLGSSPAPHRVWTRPSGGLPRLGVRHYHAPSAGVQPGSQKAPQTRACPGIQGGAWLPRDGSLAGDTEVALRPKGQREELFRQPQP